MDLACEAGHAWMRSLVHVVPHRRFAVTDARGRFEIRGVPAGASALEVRHELSREPLVVPIPEGLLEIPPRSTRGRDATP